MNYAKDLAAAHTQQRIKDTVITVPPFFNQAERRSLLIAADLAGLKVSFYFYIFHLKTQFYTYLILVHHLEEMK